MPGSRESSGRATPRASHAPRSPDPTRSARWAAAAALSEQAARFPDLLPAAPETAGLTDRDAALAHAIYDASIRHWLTLRHLLSGFLRQPFDALEQPLQAVLLSGAAQALILDRIPIHAALNESVELAKREVRPGAGGLVNAVLRKVAALRAGESSRPAGWPDHRDLIPLGDGRARRLTEAALPDDPADRLATATSHPRWVIDRWMAGHGMDTAASLALHSLAAPPTILNTAFAALPLPRGLAPHTAPGHHVFTGPRAALADLLSARTDLWVQDPASSRAIDDSRHLTPRTIVDLCAGQGTKTRQLAAAFPAARILATDIDESRFATLADTWRGHARVDALPFSALLARAAAAADLVLLDVPCSNTGVLARRIEAKYRCSDAQLQRLADLQRRILDQAAPLLAPAGRILYTTCSIDAEENELQAQDAARRLGLTIEHSRLSLPAGLPGDAPKMYHDGSYAALLARA
ncbi:MAG: transcription antitermination factor NusB [Phycisphaerales bacterium]